jgi:hypothetical protein
MQKIELTKDLKIQAINEIKNTFRPKEMKI